MYGKLTLRTKTTRTSNLSAGPRDLSRVRSVDKSETRGGPRVLSLRFGNEFIVSNSVLTNWPYICYWVPINSDGVSEVPLQHQWKINLWGGIVGDQVIGPYCIRGNLDDVKYLTLLEDYLDYPLQHIPETFRLRMGWMQDSAGAHTALTVQGALKRRFPGRSKFFLSRSQPY